MGTGRGRGINRAIVWSCDDGLRGGLLLGYEAPTWAGLELADKTAAEGSVSCKSTHA